MRAAGEIEQVVAISSGPAGRRREAPGTPERKEKQVSEPRPAVSYWGARVESNLLSRPWVPHCMGTQVRLSQVDTTQPPSLPQALFPSEKGHYV